MSITQSGGAVIAYSKGIRSNFGASIGAGFDGAGQGSLTNTVEVTELGTITFNGNAFAKAMAKSSDAAQYNLGAALYNYGAAANALPSARTQTASRRRNAFWLRLS